mmetsp:Transcript_8825/g.27381  ORF Transcript_8825/g.27381 Transcript_8825/m.27381 type:complete len:609 (-) Transcript_8825:131-1957(-)
MKFVVNDHTAQTTMRLDSLLSVYMLLRRVALAAVRLCSIRPLCRHDALGAQHVEHAAAHLVDAALGVAQKHVRVCVEEERVLHIGVPARQRALEHDDLLGAPHLDHRHARQLRVGVFHSRWVDCVVGTDHQHRVVLLDVRVDLVHFVHQVVRHASLREQHVQLPRHAPRHGMDGAGHLLAVGSQQVHEVRQAVLSLGHSQAVARHDEHALRLHDGVGGGLHVGHHALAALDVAHHGGTALCAGECALDAQEHVDHRAVHRMAHVQAEKPARRADERADNGQQLVGQHEALRAQRPAAQRVENRDDDRRVGRTDGAGHVGAQEEREAHGRAEGAHTALDGGSGHEGEQRGHAAAQRQQVDQILGGKGDALAGHEPLQLAEGRDAAGEGHRADERARPNGKLVARIGGRVRGERSDAGERRRKADERMKGRHQLRQIGDRRPVGDHQAHGRAGGEDPAHLLCKRGAHGWRHGCQRGRQPQRHAGGAQRVASAGRLLARKAPDGADAADRRGKPHRRVRSGGGSAGCHRLGVEGQRADGGQRVEPLVRRRVIWSAEHREHAASHQEAASDVDRAHSHGGRCGDCHRCDGYHAAGHEREAAERRGPADGVRH